MDSWLHGKHYTPAQGVCLGSSFWSSISETLCPEGSLEHLQLPRHAVSLPSVPVYPHLLTALDLPVTFTIFRGLCPPPFSLFLQLTPRCMPSPAPCAAATSATATAGALFPAQLSPPKVIKSRPGKPLRCCNTRWQQKKSSPCQPTK